MVSPRFTTQELRWARRKLLLSRVARTPTNHRGRVSRGRLQQQRFGTGGVKVLDLLALDRLVQPWKLSKKRGKEHQTTAVRPNGRSLSMMMPSSHRVSGVLFVLPYCASEIVSKIAASCLLLGAVWPLDLLAHRLLLLYVRCAGAARESFL